MRVTANLAVLSAVCSIMAAPAFAADDCKPSERWGAEDQIGSANLVSPERTKAALTLVKQGKTVPLGIVIDSKTPAFPPRSLAMQVVQPNQQGGQRLFGYNGNYNDDILYTWLGIGSQIDGLGHLGEDGLYYNCATDKEIAAITGLKKYGTHQIPPLVGRGIVINMAKHFGKDVLEAGKVFNEGDIQAAAKTQGVDIREGDIVLFHTGWTDHKFEKEPEVWGSSEPGLGESGAEWLASMNVMAVGADTWGLEPVPPEKEGRPFYGHVTLLKKNGIYILETMNTGLLTKEGVTEFMFVLGQARVRGAVQMIINPVAMY